MDQKYSHIDIAVSYKGIGGMLTHRSFNGGPIVSLPSLRDIATHFVNLSHGYMMWRAAGKHNILYFEMTPERDAASLLINMRIDEQMVVEGAAVINFVGAVKTCIISGGNLTAAMIEMFVGQSGFVAEPRICRIIGGAGSGRSICCRSYESRTELTDILSFPDQSAYEPYKAVLVYPAEAQLQSDSILPCITVPLVKERSVIEPEVKRNAVVLSLDFGDNRVIEVPLNLEKNGDEYQNLRGGSFHGFHARGVLGREVETFNVDLHSVVEIQSSQSAPSVQPVEVVAEEDSEVTTQKPAAETVNEEIEIAETTEKNGRRRLIWLFTIILLLLVGAGVWWLMQSADKEPAEEPPLVIEVPEEEPAPEKSVDEVVLPEQPVPAKTNSAESDSLALKDIAYLNSTDKWDRTKLVSPVYQQLIDHLAAGDISAVVAHEYFAKSGVATNKTATSVADMLWKAKGTDTEASNVRELKRLKINDKVDLREVYKKIQLYQPRTPNAEPRPQR